MQAVACLSTLSLHIRDLIVAHDRTLLTVKCVVLLTLLSLQTVPSFVLLIDDRSCIVIADMEI